MKLLNRITKNNKTKKDVFLMLVIIILPFVFYIYNLAPRTAKWKTTWFEIDSGFYDDVNMFLWLLSIKFFTILILCIWFITCSYKWRYVLLFPLLFESYKVIVGFKIVDFGHFNDVPYVNSLYLFVPLVVILFLIDRKTGYYKKKDSIQGAINTEIIKLSKFDMKIHKTIKSELSELSEKKDLIDQKTYLLKLIALREKVNF
ncbi:MAG: hypothetical protein V7719_15600 [Psychroserpens sp.]|uniref:hypothetical protein n=1 Tax=Psychroserpens sp. TaxID=2020870 RepID=UPI0030034AF6